MNDAALAALFLLACRPNGDEPAVALRDVIAAADFYERMVLEHAEIERAVRFLLARDLVTVDGARFAPTPAGHELVDGSVPRTRLAAILEKLPEQRPTVEWAIDPADVDAAADAYAELWRNRTES